MRAKKKIIPASYYRTKEIKTPGIHSIAEPEKKPAQRHEAAFKHVFSQQIDTGFKPKFK